MTLGQNVKTTPLTTAEAKEYEHFIRSAAADKMRAAKILPAYGGLLDHRYIMLTQMFNGATDKVKMLLQNFASNYESDSLISYLSALKSAVYRNVHIKILTLQEPLDSPEFNAINELIMAKNDVISLKVASEEAKSYLFNVQDGGSAHTSVGFEVFDDSVVRFQENINDSVGTANFKNTKLAAKCTGIFYKAYQLS